MSKRIVLYTRYSSDMQREESCEDQEREARAREVTHLRGQVLFSAAFAIPLMLIAMVVYGGWFWLAQSVQTTASEAARAAVGGLDEAERRILVMAVAADSRSGGLDPAKLTMDVTTEDGVMRVRAAYDVAYAGFYDRPVPGSDVEILSFAVTVARRLTIRDL